MIDCLLNCQLDRNRSWQWKKRRSHLDGEETLSMVGLNLCAMDLLDDMAESAESG